MDVTIKSLFREPCAVKAAYPVLTGGLGRRTVRQRALILPTWNVDFSTLLEDSLVDDHCSPVGVSRVLPWALASGEIPAPARVRVCVGLLTGVRACGGFPSPCLACDAPVRVPLSAGCTMDGYCPYFDRAALATGLARRPWHRAHVGRSSACVSLVTCDDGSSVVSLALPMGSFA